LTWTRTAGFWPPLIVTAPTPGQLGDLLREARVGVVLDLRERDRIRGEREREDGRVGGVDLVVDRRHRQLRRQVALRGVDRLLHVLLGDVDVQAERELQRDDGRALGAGGEHLVQPGHLAELPLERRGDGRGDDVRARAGVERQTCIVG
jgi:hypothetical protein